MQSVVTTSLDTTDIYTDKKRPSAKLQEKIKTCVSMFRSLNETVNEVIEIGKSEGFTPKEIGQFIRQEMIKSGLSTRTVTRYLPAELKAKPRGFQVSNANANANVIRDKMSLNHSQSQPQPETQAHTGDIDIEAFSMAARYLRPEILGKVIDNLAQVYKTKSVPIRDKMSLNSTSEPEFKQIQPAAAVDIEAFSMADRYLYKHEFLGKVIDHLAQVYNEKTGQKIIVIFRKMIEDGTTKDKKYQPSIDEVKKRENKVLSLVKEGIVKISEIVKQSGVSETATRRYLQKAGYRITSGTVSR